MAAISAHEEHDAHADHGDGIYWKVFFFLFVLTALEVSTYWWPESMHKVTHTLLIVMMIVKFATVALYFMHLKGDPKVLQRVFLAGLLLAGGVYIAALGAMVFFEDSGTTEYNYPPREKPLPPPPTDPPPVIRETQGGHG